MNFSVVIPVRNRPGLIAQCVAGIRAINYPPDQFEIIVVDNGSTDDTPDRAAAAGARVIREPLPNRCVARNRGAREARHPWVAFIDSDCVPHPDWLTELAAAITRETESPAAQPEALGAIAGAVHSPPQTTPIEHYFEHRGWFDQTKYLFPAPDARFTEPFALTANLCVRRDVYLETGGLDPTLPYPGEDADWCWRLRRAGFALGWAPRAGVIHYHRATLGGLFRQSLHWGRGQADLFAKWQAEWGASDWLEPRHYVWALKGLLKLPYAYVVETDPFRKRLPLYDFLANAGLAAGRATGGLHHRKLVL